MERLLKKYIAPVVFCLVYLAVVFIFSVVSYFFNFTDEVLSLGGYIISVIFILLSAVFASVKAEKKGWLQGIKAGGVFVGAVFLISFLVSGGEVDVQKMILRIPFYTFVSLIGGIIGINLRQ